MGISLYCMVYAGIWNLLGPFVIDKLAGFVVKNVQQVSWITRIHQYR